jgi:hypothetical protein
MVEYTFVLTSGKYHQQNLYKMRYLLREHGKGYWNWDLVLVIKTLKIEKPKVLFYPMFPDFRRSTVFDGP